MNIINNISEELFFYSTGKTTIFINGAMSSENENNNPVFPVNILGQKIVSEIEAKELQFFSSNKTTINISSEIVSKMGELFRTGVYVIPRRNDLGFFSGSANAYIDLWNASDSTVTIYSLSLSDNSEAAIVTNLFPLELKPNMVRTIIVNIKETELVEFSVKGTFTSSELVLPFYVSGYRVQFLRYIPEPGVTASYKWNTDTQYSVVGTERRLGIGNAPLLEINESFNIQDARDIDNLEGFMLANTGKGLFPMWHRAAFLKKDVNARDKKIYINTRRMGIVPQDTVVIAGEGGDIRTIAEVHDDYIIIEGEAGKPYKRGNYIAPVITGFIKDGATLDRLAYDNDSTLKLSILTTENSFIDGGLDLPPLVYINGIDAPLITISREANNGDTKTFQGDYKLVSTNIGAINAHKKSKGSLSELGLSYRVAINDYDSYRHLISVLAYAKGSLNEICYIDGRGLGKVVSQIHRAIEGTTILTTDHQRAGSLFDVDFSFIGIEVAYTDKTKTLHRVVSAKGSNTGVSQFEVFPQIEEEKRAIIERITPIKKVRIIDDKVEVKYSGIYIVFSFNVKAVR